MTSSSPTPTTTPTASTSLTLATLAGAKRVLLAVAAPKEAEAILRAISVTTERRTFDPTKRIALHPRIDMVVTGVGKAAAASSVSHVLATSPERYSGVLNMGLAGVLPPGDASLIGRTVIATASVLADEGVQAPSEYIGLDRMGFSPMPDGSCAIAATPAWFAALRAMWPDALTGVVATVSTCSGTDELARAIAQRCAAGAEAMEGAACALSAARAATATGSAIAFAEVRVLSNTTGDRTKQVWKLQESLAALGRVAASLSGQESR